MRPMVACMWVINPEKALLPVQIRLIILPAGMVQGRFRVGECGAQDLRPSGVPQQVHTTRITS